jgi:dienelactone hydrolase
MRMRSAQLALMVSLLAGVISCARPPTPPPVPAADVTVLATEFVDLLVKLDFGQATQMMDATMRSQVGGDKLGEIWKQLLGQVGPFENKAGTRTEKSGSYDVVFVTCRFELDTLDVKVVLDSAGRVSGLWFAPSQLQTDWEPPAYARLDAFQEKEVSVGQGEWTLPGTLTLPLSGGPFAAVVLVHGSGPNDRDETVGANKPFRDLAWGLASQGIAVLRYEKRTREYASKLASLDTALTVKEESIDDALAAVDLLRNIEGMDNNRVFVLGHSLGGTIAPRIGRLDPEICGLIVMAGATRPLEDLMLAQTSYIFSLDGTISEAERAQLDQLEQQVEQVKDPNLSQTMRPTDMLLGAPVQYWLDLRNYQPAEFAQELQQPMLILQGERDYQVTLADYEGWKQALGARSNVTFKLYPSLNHLFMAGQGKSIPAEYETTGHVAEEVILDIAAWVQQLPLSR